jgi:signal transduction histidine kinase
MKARRYQLTLFILPAFVVVVFETIRHNFCIPYVSLQTGNWILALITALVISMTSSGLFSHFEQTERALREEREKRVLLEERERLARELHDRIAQSIFYAGAQVRAVLQVESNETPHGHEPLSEQLNQLHLTLREMDDNVRQVIFNLRQAPGESAEFVDRVKLFLENALTKWGITWDANISQEISMLNSQQQVQLFGILQEGITNVVKHAKASHVDVSFARHKQGFQKSWRFTIRDDGKGFVEMDFERHQYGLDILRCRAKEAGGTLQIASTKEGTTLVVMGPASES